GRWSRRYLVDGWDSRLRLPDRSDPQVAALLARGDALAARVSEKKAARQALADSLLDPALRAELDGTIGELAGLEAQLRALRPQPGRYPKRIRPQRLPAIACGAPRLACQQLRGRWEPQAAPPPHPPQRCLPPGLGGGPGGGAGGRGQPVPVADEPAAVGRGVD